MQLQLHYWRAVGCAMLGQPRARALHYHLSPRSSCKQSTRWQARWHSVTTRLALGWHSQSRNIFFAALRVMRRWLQPCARQGPVCTTEWHVGEAGLNRRLTRTAEGATRAWHPHARQQQLLHIAQQSGSPPTSSSARVAPVTRQWVGALPSSSASESCTCRMQARKSR